MVSRIGRKKEGEAINKETFINCDCFDKNTSKVLQHLINKEKKYLGKYPSVMVGDAKYDMDELMKRLLDCSAMKKNVKKGGKKVNVRNQFMSGCMRSEAKGGDGKSMGDCSKFYKDLKERGEVQDYISKKEKKGKI